MTVRFRAARMEATLIRDSVNAQSPPGTLPFGLPCIHCDYDLRGQKPTAQCPECGAAVMDSLRQNRAIFCDAKWLREVRRGVRGLSRLWRWGLLAAGAALALALPDTGDSNVRMRRLATALSMGVLLPAAWFTYLTAVRNYPDRRAGMAWRLLAMILPLVWGSALVLLHHDTHFQFGPPLDIWGIGAALVGIMAVCNVALPMIERVLLRGMYEPPGRRAARASLEFAGGLLLTIGLPLTAAVCTGPAMTGIWTLPRSVRAAVAWVAYVATVDAIFPVAVSLAARRTERLIERVRRQHVDYDEVTKVIWADYKSSSRTETESPPAEDPDV